MVPCNQNYRIITVLPVVFNTRKLLTGDDLEAIPEVSDLDVRDDCTVPAVDQVYILVSKLLAESIRHPQTRIKLLVDTGHQHRLKQKTKTADLYS